MNKMMSKRWGIPLVIVLMLICIFYIPLPFFVTVPGDALELRPLVQVQDGFHEQGTFMLTTVRMLGANPYQYLSASWNNYKELIPKEVLLADYQDEEEYSDYQLQLMQSSKDAAIVVAYRLADKPIEIKYEGVFVTKIVPEMPADGVLFKGDLITHIDQERIRTTEQLINYVQGKQVGDQIKLRFQREGKEQVEILSLAELPLSPQQGEESRPRAGIGISLLSKYTLGAIEPPIEINTEAIGGPSAGLMFTLEIYNQLTEEDLTKGYRIAGTGQIDLEGRVQRIGGVHQKVVAAHQAQTEIFFAPNEGGSEHSNYQVARLAAADIGTPMKIIPVDTVQDALDYLSTLPPK